MRDFYAAARLEELWLKHRPALQAENDRFRPFAQQAIDDIVGYCRLRATYYADSTAMIHFQSVPLMLYWTAWTAVVNGERWIVSGPQVGDPGPDAFYHEALHPVITPLLHKYAAEVDRLGPLLPVAKSKPSVGYDDWQSLVGDCFARTLDKVISARRYHFDRMHLDRQIEAEYRLGFILAPVIAEGLQHYERQGKSFPDYFPALLNQVNLAKERRRWEEFWSRPVEQPTAREK